MNLGLHPESESATLTVRMDISSLLNPGGNYDAWRKVKVTIDPGPQEHSMLSGLKGTTPAIITVASILKEKKKDIEYIEVWGTESDSELGISIRSSGHFLTMCQ